MKPDVQNDESVLLQGLMSNSPEAFTQLVAEYKDMVYRTCLGFVHNAADADDLAQEVFMQVYFSIKSFRKDAKLSTWLYRIAVNKSLNYVQSAKRKQTESMDSDNDDYTVQWLDNNSMQPDEVMENSQQNQQIYKAIDSLPDSQKVAFTLSKFEGLSYKQIAEVTDSSLPAIESLLHRAKKALQKKLTKLYKS